MEWVTVSQSPRRLAPPPVVEDKASPRSAPAKAAKAVTGTATIQEVWRKRVAPLLRMVRGNMTAPWRAVTFDRGVVRVLPDGCGYAEAVLDVAVPIGCGPVTVDAKALPANLPAGACPLLVDKSGVKIGSTLYPAMPECDAVERVEPGKRLAAYAYPVEVLRWLALASSRDETRPNLGGIYLADKLAVATDSHRMHKWELDGGNLQAPAVLLPLYVVGLFRHADTVTVYGIESGGVLVRSEGIEVYTNQLDGQFPEFRQVWPGEFEAGVELDAQELAVALTEAERVGKVGKSECRGCAKFFAHPVHPALVVEGCNVEAPCMVCVGIKGGKWYKQAIGFNPRYINDAILDAGRVLLDVIDDLSPMQVRWPDPSSGRKAIVMPVKI